MKPKRRHMIGAVVAVAVIAAALAFSGAAAQTTTTTPDTLSGLADQLRAEIAAVRLIADDASDDAAASKSAADFNSSVLTTLSARVVNLETTSPTAGAVTCHSYGHEHRHVYYPYTQRVFYSVGSHEICDNGDENYHWDIKIHGNGTSDTWTCKGDYLDDGFQGHFSDHAAVKAQLITAGAHSTCAVDSLTNPRGSDTDGSRHEMWVCDIHRICVGYDEDLHGVISDQRGNHQYPPQ